MIEVDVSALSCRNSSIAFFSDTDSVAFSFLHEVDKKPGGNWKLTLQHRSNCFGLSVTCTLPDRVLVLPSPLGTSLFDLSHTTRHPRSQFAPPVITSRYLWCRDKDGLDPL